MIEPKKPKTDPVNDSLTFLASELSAKLTKGITYRGFHVCSCGKASGNCELTLPDGRITNSLLVHYISEHRSEVPKSEIAKLLEYQERPNP